MLATFERCPHQFHRKYVEKSRRPSLQHRPRLRQRRARGLAGVLEVYRRTGGYPINLRERVENALRAAAIRTAVRWAADVERVVAWVKAALGGIDETARVLQVERWLEYRFPGCADCPPFLLRHRVDLVLEHRTGRWSIVTGRPAAASRWTSAERGGAHRRRARRSRITRGSSARRRSSRMGWCRSTS